MSGQLVEAVLEIVFYGIIGVVISLVYKATSLKEKAS
jgi:type III secretory pathway component EscS